MTEQVHEVTVVPPAPEPKKHRLSKKKFAQWSTVGLTAAGSIALFVSKLKKRSKAEETDAAVNVETVDIESNPLD